MKTKYYLYGTILGLCMIPLVAAFLLGPKEFLRLFPEWRMSLTFGLGYAAALAAGASADRYVRRRGFIATVAVLVGIFILGAFFGCLANLFINGNPFRSPFGLREEIWDWFVKPVYWLTVIGVPCAVIVAITHYLGNYLIGRWRARQGAT